MHIALNPGHYIDHDPGAIGQRGVREVDINIAVSDKLKALLEDAGHEVTLIHKNELHEIVIAANNADADIFISIHCNAATNPEAHGTETFYCAGSERGRQLAQSIQSSLIAATGLANRGIKTNSLYVTKHTAMPAVLIELAFISNLHEEMLLSCDKWQQKAIEAVYKGVQNYDY